MGAEHLGIEVTGLEVIQEEEEKERPADGAEEERSDMDDFVKQEIEGTGLSFNNSYSVEQSSSSREGVRHTSKNLIRDDKIMKDQEHK